MARYVLVEFENDTDAEKLRKMIDEQTKRGKLYRVVGIYARPKRFCECSRVEGYHKALVARGARFGWNVCVVCKRPKKGYHPLANLLAIVDILRMPGEPIAGAYEYRADSLNIFEVPVKNIEKTKELTHGG